MIKREKLIRLLDKFRQDLGEASYDLDGRALPPLAAEKNKQEIKEQYADKILEMFS